MEEDNSVWRRLNSISRHLQLNYEANHVLHSNFLRASDELKHVISEAVIIGAMVLDIAATPSISALPRTTTPGKVHYLAGGVARNVAECMSKLGSKPFMISTIGVDVAGNLLLGYWKSAGLALEGIQMRQDIGTPVVCNIYDMNGELATAVASVEAIEKFLTQEWIQQFRCNISYAPILMIDANLNPCSLEASCQLAAQSGIPVWFEPVSVAKSKRVVSLVKYITFASPNEDELIAMANALSHEDRFLTIKVVANSGSKRSIECLFQMLKPAMIVLLENGVKVLVLTLGSEGVLLCSKDGLRFNDLLKNTKPSSYGKQLYEIVSLSCPSKKFVSAAKSDRGGSHLYVVHFPALPASVLRLTGAGDCFVGGALTSICAGLDVMQSMAVGIAVAKAAVEVEANVPSEFSLARIADDASLIYSSAKVLFD